MPMGDSPTSENVTSLPLSDPRCNSDACDAFAAAHKASQAAVSYDHQYEYGHYTTWYYLAAIGVAMFVYVYRLNRNRRARQGVPGSERLMPTRKVLALFRAVNYRHLKGRVADYFGFPSLGAFVFIAVTSLFLLLMTFLVHPYYRGRRGYGSPPLAVRTGLMAQALTPIIVALAGKVNFITMLTGISHEKLNIFHRWISYMCLFLSIVHTVPFIVQPLREGGPAALRKQYYKPGGMEVCDFPPLRILCRMHAVKTDTRSRTVYRNSATGYTCRHCRVIHPMDSPSVLQLFLPTAHTHVHSVSRSALLAFEAGEGLVGVFVLDACNLARLMFSAPLLQVADIQHLPKLVPRVPGEA